MYTRNAWIGFKANGKVNGQDAIVEGAVFVDCYGELGEMDVTDAFLNDPHGTPIVDEEAYEMLEADSTVVAYEDN